MAKTGIADLKKGECLVFRDSPHLITDKFFVSPGKGSAFYRTKLKNLATGAVLEFTFKSNEMVEEALVETVEMQYLYPEGEELVLMNPRNYEQYRLNKEIVANFAELMKEGDIYQIFTLNDQAVSMRPPLKVRLKVTRTDPGVRGNTVTGATKEAEVETGYKLQVPLFIKEGEIIVINVANGNYVERA
ncbi:MAG: elongation factor P [Candidatus Shapirobacteria bacterium]